MNVMPVFKMIENRFRAVFSGTGGDSTSHAPRAKFISSDQQPSSATPVKRAKAKAPDKKAPARKAVAKKASKAAKAGKAKGKASKKRAR